MNTIVSSSIGRPVVANQKLFSVSGGIEIATNLSKSRQILDATFAAIGLAILSPFFLVVSAVVRLHDNGPAFHRSRRAGLNGQPFTLYKFRTMRVGGAGAGITVANDARVTGVGRFLRKYKLDELPQLVNVLKGEMALVGPRPEDPRYTTLYDAEQRKILGVRPGITSPASLAFRDEASLLSGTDWESKYVREILPQKLALDLDYFSGNTLWHDMRLIVRTLAAVVK